VALHLAYRWFCKLDLDDKVPHHSTFSVNRLGRFRQSEILRHILWPDLIYDRHRFVERLCDVAAKRPHRRASLRKPHPEHRGMKPGFSN